MRFSPISTAFMAATAAAQAVQNAIEHIERADNAFNVPKGGYHFRPGEYATLSWDPTTDGTVTLRLQDFTHTNVVTPSDGYLLAESISNGGSLNVQIPQDLPEGTYSIEIIPDSHPNDANFTPKWEIKGFDATEESSKSSVGFLTSAIAPITSSVAAPTSTPVFTPSTANAGIFTPALDPPQINPTIAFPSTSASTPPTPTDVSDSDSGAVMVVKDGYVIDALDKKTVRTVGRSTPGTSFIMA
ncbi:hypothetical protein KEM54_003586 [Ascosphaera aggregata]|nr:hypothetical protein KEM54_003586 [Ascosphaera aggregata]